MRQDPNAVYELIRGASAGGALVEAVCLGLTWTSCRTAEGIDCCHAGPSIPGDEVDTVSPSTFAVKPMIFCHYSAKFDG